MCAFISTNIFHVALKYFLLIKVVNSIICLTPISLEKKKIHVVKKRAQRLSIFFLIFHNFQLIPEKLSYNILKMMIKIMSFTCQKIYVTLQSLTEMLLFQRNIIGFFCLV